MALSDRKSTAQLLKELLEKNPDFLNKTPQNSEDSSSDEEPDFNHETNPQPIIANLQMATSPANSSNNNTYSLMELEPEAFYKTLPQPEKEQDSMDTRPDNFRL